MFTDIRHLGDFSRILQPSNLILRGAFHETPVYNNVITTQSSSLQNHPFFYQSLLNHLINQPHTTRMHQFQPESTTSGSHPPASSGQQQLFDLFIKMLKNCPPKPESPTTLNFTPFMKTQTELDTDNISQNVSLPKPSEHKDTSLDMNNLSSSTWGTLPSPPDKSNTTLNQSQLFDSKSPSDCKGVNPIPVTCPNFAQRRYPFANLNIPSCAQRNESINFGQQRNTNLPTDHQRFSLDQVLRSYKPAPEGHDWNSRFREMCEHLYCVPDTQDSPAAKTSLTHSPVKEDRNLMQLPAHYYNHLLCCQQYYEYYLYWLRLLGLNNLGHTDSENGKPTFTIPPAVQTSPQFQSSISQFPNSLASNTNVPSAHSLHDSRFTAQYISPNFPNGENSPSLSKIECHSAFKSKKYISTKNVTILGRHNNNNHGSIVSDGFGNSMDCIVSRIDENQHFACKLCPKMYSQASALKMHVRTHTLPCRCSYCGKSFSRKWLLKGHERTHTGERPYACPVCNRSFADRSNLRAHMQTHQRNKRYSCPHCPRSFSRMGLLNKHVIQCTTSESTAPRDCFSASLPTSIRLTN